MKISMIPIEYQVKCGFCNNMTYKGNPYPIYPVYKEENGKKILIEEKYQCHECNVKNRIRNY